MALDIGNHAGTASEFELVGSLQIEPEFRIGFAVAGPSPTLMYGVAKLLFAGLDRESPGK
jgi:hypothetical protein